MDCANHFSAWSRNACHLITAWWFIRAAELVGHFPNQRPSFVDEAAHALKSGH